jgi:hypothetical protein
MLALPIAAAALEAALESWCGSNGPADGSANRGGDGVLTPIFLTE